MEANNFGEQWLKLDLPFPCEIHHTQPRAVPSPDSYTVLNHTGEPYPMKWPAEEVRKYHRSFDLVLTSDRSLLDLPNARFLVLGSCWVHDLPARKEFSLSFLWSAGVRAPFAGYQLRERIFMRRHEIAIPRHFWTSRARPPAGFEAGELLYPAETKHLLFESMFSLCIENVAEPDYFSEKIIDAFATATVPVYFGCPNIADYFDPAGIIQVPDEDAFLACANALTVEDYWRRMPAMLSNRLAARPYMDVTASLRSAILESACGSAKIDALFAGCRT